MKLLHIFSVLFILTLILSSCTLPIAPSISTASPEVDTLTAITNEVQGLVEAHQATESVFIAATNGMLLQTGGQIRTGDDGRTRVDLSTGTFFRVGPSSIFTLLSNQARDNGLITRIKLEVGKVWIVLRGGEMEVDGVSGDAAVRGSYLSVEQLADGSMKITCLEGDCTFKNNAGTFNLVAGQSGIIQNNTSAPLIGKMSETDFSEWLKVNPEAQVIISAVTATQAALPMDATETALPTATATATETFTPSPVPAALSGVVQADLLSCRYGPGAYYLFEYGFIKGNRVEVLGRADTTAGTWVYVKFNDTLKPCWVNLKFLEVSGDASTLEQVYPDKAPLILFHHPNFPPPTNVEASRKGDQVEITWRGYELALGDRESKDSPQYMAELWTCQGGQIVFTPFGAFTESAVIQDEAGCFESSHGQVFLAHKDGYVGPVPIPWPAP